MYSLTTAMSSLNFSAIIPTSERGVGVGVGIPSCCSALFTASCSSLSSHGGDAHGLLHGRCGKRTAGVGTGVADGTKPSAIR